MSQLQVTGEAKIRDIQGPVVANNGVVTALDGAASQYVRGDGTLADFPTSSGGGSSVSYYLNSSVSQGTIGGVAYRELSKEPIIGAGTDITISANGYVANYLTDANDPDVILVPGGNFNCEFYFSANNNTGNPTFYAELYKYDGTTFTLLGSSVGVPESINQGTTIAPYYFAIPVATATLALTDRLAIRIYVNVDGRTVTLHTENSHLCQVVTTLSKGMVSLNNLTDQSQFITTGTSGTDFNIVSSGDTHTFNIPSASASNRGLITTGTQTIAGAKTFTDNTIFSASPLFDQSANYKVGAPLVGTGNYISMAFDKSGTGSGSILSMKLADGTTAKAINLDFLGSPATYTYTFPDLSGTLALLEGTQTFTGDKTFNGGVDFNNALNINNTFNLRNNLVGSTDYTNFSILKSGSLQTLTYLFSTANSSKLVFNDAANYTYAFPALNGTLALLEGTQTFSGNKTFSALTAFTFLNGTRMDYGLYLSKGSVPSAFSGSTVNLYSDSGNNNLVVRDNSNTSLLQFQAASSYTYTFPNASGTLAILEAGTQTFTGTVNILGPLGTKYGISMEKGNTPSPLSLNDIFISAASGATNSLKIQNNSYLSTLNFPTSNQTFTFPASSGTIALTSNLSSYVPYTGATTNVDLGNYDLTVYNIKVGRGSGGISTNTLLSYGGLQANTTGYHNVAIGTNALLLNTTGYGNTAIGSTSSQSITSGFTNTAIGYQTLGNASTASGNTVVGYNAGLNITTGSNNTIIGAYAATATMSNNVILADGQGTIRYQWNGTTNSFTGSGTFTGALTALTLYSNAGLGLSNSGQFTGGGGYTAINGRTDGIDIRPNNGGIFQFIFSNTTNRTYTFPDASGTVALTSNLTGYVQGSGTTNYLPKFTASGTIGNSSIIDNGTITAYTNAFYVYQTAGTGAAFYMTGGGTDATISSVTSGGANQNLNLMGSTLSLWTGTLGGLAYTERMRITPTGNVGIGTSSPWGKFNVYAGSNLSFVVQDAGIADTIELTNYSSGGGYRAVALNGSIVSFSTGTAGGGSATERMRITSSGYTKMSSGAGYLGGSYHEFGQSTNNQYITAFQNVSSLPYGIYVAYTGASPNGTNYEFMYCADTTNSKFIVWSNGSVINRTGSYGTISDIKFKENIVDASPKLDDLLKLKVRNFNMIGDETKQIGFIAQEFEEVFPKMVDISTDKESGEEFKSIKTSVLVPMLVKAIQELSAKVTALENK